MEDELAIIETSPSRMTEVIENAALYGGGRDAHSEIYVRVDGEAFETPAGASDATQSSYCTFSADRFERLRACEEVAALVSVDELLYWLGWLNDEPSLRISFIGTNGAEVASRLILTGEDRTVTLSCIDDPTVLRGVETWLPDRFEDGTFLLDDGEPAPTTIETTAAGLETIVQAVEGCGKTDRYPLAADESGLSFDVSGKTAEATGEIEATVEGPAIDNMYGPGFARVVQGLSGRLTLQTGPNADLVIISGQPGTRLRYYVAFQTTRS